ncbi:MAG: hypothetical protein EBU34_10715 [Alphaproteobacteria bacterium]|nr:hypothetical protein [Alphaproteobacteria bacterium]
MFPPKGTQKKSPRKDVVIHAQGASSFRQDVVTAHSCHKAWFFRSLAEQRTFSWPWLRKICNPLHYFTIFIETVQYHRENSCRVIAISQVIKSELIQYYRIDPRRIVVIHSGVDCVRYHPGHRNEFRADVRASLGISNSATVLCFVANEFRRKGLALHLEPRQFWHQKRGRDGRWRIGLAFGTGD